MRIAEVALFAAFDKWLTYSIPESLRFTVSVGSLVHVFLGKNKKIGLVVTIREAAELPLYPLKPILNTLYDISITSETLVQLYRWVSNYYLADFHHVLETAIPSVIRKVVPPKLKTYLRFNEVTELAIDPQKLPKQYEALTFLQEHSFIEKSLFLEKFSRNILDALLRKNIIYETFKCKLRSGYEGLFLPGNHEVQLTQEQKKVAQSVEKSLKARTFCVHLLYGVTGSGKTEVYITLIRSILQKGGSILYLVPELTLTAQAIKKLRTRLGDLPIIVWHSGLSDGERRDAWFHTLTSSSSLVVGARSAIFLPVNNLRLIIVDEEHDTAYKQEEAPRYQGRDVAIYRAKLEQAVCLLGSATPSIESYFNATKQRYLLEQLPHRIDQHPFPQVKVVDMRCEKAPALNPFSRVLKSAIIERLERREQVILFLNRRGFAPTVLCKYCDYIAMCPHCSVPLTYHQATQRLHCHFCNYEELKVAHCPRCGAQEIVYYGIGTQRVEQAIQEQFPQARASRIDSDMLTKKYVFIDILEQFQRKEIDILIGTQMIAKGLDFPDVTLVGLINADGALNQQDFRAHERTFQLLVQVAGRSGRGNHPGEVIIQTHIPDNEILYFAKNTDYLSFFARELTVRRTFGYPPFQRIIVLQISGRNGQLAELFALELTKRLKQTLTSFSHHVEIKGPMNAAIEKIRDQYRFSIFVFTTHLTQLATILKPFFKETKIPEGIVLAIDVDAQNFS